MAVRPDSSTPTTARAILAGVAATLAALALSRAVRRVKVEGRSMAPAFLPGDCLVVVKPAPRRLAALFGGASGVKPGEVVAVRDPRHPGRVLVKRVSSVDSNAGTVEVLGDASQASTDSRTFGPVPMSSVLGRAVYRYAPPGRTGRRPWAAEYDRG
jgi:nickel-type superoxide dismutase maturation protease